ncbi:MAG: hypothetical protein JO078_01295 [Candidatus Eremiobacteraeota bacterium]|nr:hypothetical protein [Candidatus Eremiobacteraeota bacterium]MBV9057214.1 hypothetical protein [Candidatus Eremiobacteraeota bacterium]MBV9698736.1 hypothetical protein [Candidatus Eremiobacteraeota bacterium]
MRFRVPRTLALVTIPAIFLAGVLPGNAAAVTAESQETLALQMLNGQSCTVAQAPVTTPSPSASPNPPATPGPANAPPGVNNGTYTLNPTPRPFPGQTPSVTPPPIPSATPNPVASLEPIFLVRGGSTPPPIPPAGQATPEPTAAPTGAPTLAPGFVAIISDTWSGNRARGQPSDAIGNVHVFYGDEEIVGDKAHFDGIRTITITGNPFLVNHEHNSVLTGDVIVFDTVEQTAKLLNGKGASDEGVQRGLVHFQASDLHTNPDGTAYGINPYVTTCENPRGGYHITGKDMEVYPGDKIVIHKAVLWLGLAAIFYLPLLVIPLRTVENQRTRAKWFPEVGYDSYEGAWIKIQIPFGKDQYYYGYYIVNYFTKLGFGLGYVGFYSSKKGRRSVSVNLYSVNGGGGSGRQTNFSLAEQENISQHLKSNFQFAYQSNYGPLVSIPPNETLTEAVTHQTAQTSQNYSFSHSSVGGQSNSNSFTATDTRQFNQALNQTTTFNLTTSSASFGGLSSFSNQSEFDYLLQYTTSGADYQMEFDKIYSQQAVGINKIPEFQVRPSDFFQHFFLPLSAQLTFGEYSEPSGTGEPRSLATWRGDANLVVGPVEEKVLGSDFQGTVTVDQYAYGTGDLKAAIEQDLSLTTPLSRHMVNTLTYNEANYNGPALVPFQYLDQQPTQNTKNAQDMLRIFNDDIYALSLGWTTNFDGMAQPFSYQLTAKPSARSVVMLAGSLVPGQGFQPTNLQLSTPFGRDASLQFVTNVNWKGPGELLSDKIIYYTRTIGNCYQLMVLYNESQQSVNVGLNLLAFPTQTAVFQIGSPQQVVPTTFNF